MSDIFTFLIGGEAGFGAKKAGNVASHLFAGMGREIFQMDDYQSLIRGGHNFSCVSTSEDEIYSHYLTVDLLVALDERSYVKHLKQVKDDGILIFNSDKQESDTGIGIPFSSEARKYPNRDQIQGVGAVAVLSASIGLSSDDMKGVIEREYPRGIENNIEYANVIYELVPEGLRGRFEIDSGGWEKPVIYGNEAIALGASAGGLDIYYAYPMTPSSSILHYLAKHDRELGVTVIHPENEIAVANMAVGSAFMGARVMVGTSGGGFALMEETFSLAGMTEAPVLFVLSSRPGPSTGVPTYTEQADLWFALNQGHGEFPVVVASPGTVEEAFYLSAELLNVAHKFQTPSILLTEKHLSESAMTVDLDPTRIDREEPLKHTSGEYRRYRDTEDGISPLLFPPTGDLNKWNSYEHKEDGITTEEPEEIVKMHDKRFRKGETINEYLKGEKTVNEFGQGEVVIFTYGSTTMSVLEALKNTDVEATVVQLIYLEPLPVWEIEKYHNSERIMVVEQSASGQFARLLSERGGMRIDKVINRYDGRPFESIGLAKEIEEAI